MAHTETSQETCPKTQKDTRDTRQGFLLTLEGIDGSGKSTLAQTLVRELSNRGYTVVATREPGGTPVGSSLCTLLRQNTLCGEAEFLLFIADRAEHLTRVVWPALEAGSVVICDRMIDSTWAYQGYGRGIDLSLIRYMNDWLLRKRMPDLTLYLRLEYKTARERLAARNKLDGFEKMPKEFFERVIAGFESLVDDESSANAEGASRIVALPAEGSAEDVFGAALEHVERRISAHPGIVSP